MEVIKGYKRKYIGDPDDHEMFYVLSKIPLFGALVLFTAAYHIDMDHTASDTYFPPEHNHRIVRAIKTPFELAISVRDALRK